MHSPSSPLFSVIICTYQRYDMLSQSIASVLAQNIGTEHFDIWVMDNSPDQPERTASKNTYANTPNLHYITLDTPGLSNARNTAIEMAQGQYLVFLDDDATASTGWLGHYRDAFMQLGTGAVAIGGKIAAKFGVPQPAWLHPALLGFLSVIDWYPVITELPEMHTPVGANVAFRRDALVQSGGFRATLGRQGAEANNLLSGEEAQLVERMRANGGKFYYAPLPEVTHHIPAERLTRPWFRRRAAWQAVTDQMKQSLNPEYNRFLWGKIFEYVRQVPPEQAVFMGLCWDTDDPELFRQQITCIQFLTQLMLAEGQYPAGLFN